MECLLLECAKGFTICCKYCECKEECNNVCPDADKNKCPIHMLEKKENNNVKY